MSTWLAFPSEVGQQVHPDVRDDLTMSASLQLALLHLIQLHIADVAGSA